MAIQQPTKNTWGSKGGQNGQRADLWQVDFTHAINRMNTVLDLNRNVALGEASATGMNAPSEIPKSPSVPPIYVQGITLPELKVSAQVGYRDSRPYYFPDYDDAIEPVRMKFLMDAPDESVPVVIQFLNTWRTIVRAGRGPRGREMSIRLNSSYRIEYAWDVQLILLRGSAKRDTNELLGFKNDLTISSTILLEGAWLSSYQISEFSYTNGNLNTTIDAVFYVDNIVFRGLGI